MAENDKDIQIKIMALESMLSDIYDSVVNNKKICPICKNEVRVFLPFGVKIRPDAMCPECRSLERHRALWLYLEKNPKIFSGNQQLKILHFAPERIFYNKISKMENVDYYPVDYNPDYPGIRMQVDITDIQFENEFFDVIICNHVLEHIIDEKKAINELYRVLKANGLALLNSPIDQGREVTLEEPDYNTSELREKYYGQSDHVRLYGRDYKMRLEESGFLVEETFPNKEYSKSERRKYGLIENEAIYLCKKIKA